jgi:hypothetical protein
MPEPGPQKKLCVKKTFSFKRACATAAGGCLCAAKCGAAKHVPVAQAGMQLEVPPVDFLARYEAAVAQGFLHCDIVQDEHGRFSRAMPHDTWRAMREQGFA